VAEEIIAGYRLLKHLATGQTSQVWEVVEAASNRHFAMKLLLPEKARDASHRKMLFHEAEVGKQLAHPSIIKIAAILRDPVNPCFVMEYFPAGSLKLRLLNKQHDFIREHAQEILKQAATGLAFMNAKGWVHRDVKLDNILVNSAGSVRLIDFALADKIRSGFRLFRRRAKQVVGTRSYMSPEQIRGLRLDGRADVYSFGASVYELVTGRPPFRGMSAQELLQKHIIERPQTPRVYNPDLTEEFADLVLRMLAKKREERPHDFHQVLMQLRGLRVFKGEPVSKSEAEQGR
jgi:serine/threonine protein kinase